MSDEVQLRRKWSLGLRIGDPSGFGRVFEATADDGTPGVIKLIPKKPGADRELLFEDLGGIPNVVPIVDSGETADDWVIAMPKAERSLRAEIDAAGGTIAEDEAVPILIDIAQALAALDGKVVHRDLKPENVLLVDGNWALADFGIARYAEASTAPDTWKAALSAPYAAPERWRMERASSATDVYSLGVIAFELVMGRRPFEGPTFDDLREQHLHTEVPEMTGITPVLAGLIAECLFKAAGSRPSPKNVLARLERAQTTPPPGAARLQAANARVQAAQGQEHARASAAMTEAERQQTLFDTAARTLRSISSQMRQAAIDNAPAAQPARGTDFDDWALVLGGGTIGMDPATRPKPNAWGNYKPLIDVIAFASIGIQIPRDRYGYRGRLHALWYCDAQEEGVYRWFETGFMISPLIPQRTEYFPFAFEPNENAGKALSRTMAEWQLAWPFMAIDQGEDDEFIGRWLDWFGQAAVGELHQPSSMPERPTDGSWRN
jgi:serine/threonine protein kinase